MRERKAGLKGSQEHDPILIEIHVEPEDLNAEAVRLGARIKKNFEELGV